jgi:limonene-1,2-epoxide hydrolase
MDMSRRRFSTRALSIAGGSLGAVHVADAATRRPAHADGGAQGPAVQTVDRFLKAYWGMDVDSLAPLATDDFRWENMPNRAQMTIAGKAALLKLMKENHGGFPEPIEAGEYVFVRAVAEGNVVFHERVDRMKLRGKWIEIPCLAHWEVRHGQVALWRDYYDLKTYLDGLAAVGLKASAAG